MTFNPRRVSSWKIAALMAGVFALLAFAGWGWVQIVIERQWDQMDRTIQALFEEARALEPPRPLLRDDPLSGDAWDFYREALGHLQTPDTALERLRRGARCAVAGSPYEASAPGASLLFGVIAEPWDELMQLAIARAEVLRKESRPGEAVEVLLDVCQFGRDMAQHGSPSAWSRGEYIQKDAFAGLRDLLLQERLPGESLVRMERSLQVLDESFHSSGSNVLNAAALLGRAIRDDRFKELRGELFASPPPPDPVPTWRSAWSVRLEKSKSFAFISSWLRRMAAAESRSWSASQEEYGRVRQEALAVGRSGRHAILEYLGLDRCRPSIAARDLRAQLRLLRVASRFLASGEVLELDDPYGEKLRFSRAGDRLKVWSRGFDGVDDHGEGTWLTGRDCVLEVRR